MGWPPKGNKVYVNEREKEEGHCHERNAISKVQKWAGHFSLWTQGKNHLIGRRSRKDIELGITRKKLRDLVSIILR